MDYRLLALVACSLLPAFGCGAEEDPELAPREDPFSIFPAHASMLPEIEHAGGEVSVCIAVLDAPPSDVESWRARTRANIDGTIKSWNALLKDNPRWSTPDIRTRYVYTEGSRCSPSAAMVKVNVWTTVERFKAEHCATRQICASSAAPDERTFFLGPWNRARPDDPLDPFLTLHEYGHLLGVGDTYTIPGMHTWIGEQPPSVMSGASAVLTEDDKLGLWVVLRAVKTGVRSCEGFGANMPMTDNKWNVVMCDSKGYFIDTHGDVMFQLGPIPADDLNKAKRVTIGTQGLNCRSGPGTEFDVVATTSRGATYDTAEASPGVRFRVSADKTPWVRLAVPAAAGAATLCYVAARFELVTPAS